MLANYIALMKLRVVELLLVTTVPALFLASNGVPDLKITIATLIGGTLAAGGANTLNMILESESDEKKIAKLEQLQKMLEGEQKQFNIPPGAMF
jgi:heme O synthase-like polyprenyltransferase